MNLTKTLRKPFLITLAAFAVACGGDTAPVEEPHANPPAPADAASAAATAAATAAPTAAPAAK